MNVLHFGSKMMSCSTQLGLLELQDHWTEQGHHHDGDQAAQRPHILCLICVPSFGDFAESCTIVHCKIGRASCRERV